MRERRGVAIDPPEALYLFFIIALPLQAFFMFVYLFLCPAGTTLKDRAVFETAVITALIAACIAGGVLAYETVGRGTDSAWWPVIAFINCMAAIPMVLALAAIIRALIYRKR